MAPAQAFYARWLTFRRVQQYFVEILKGNRSGALLWTPPENPDCKTGAPRKSVEIFLGGGKLYHVSIRQTNVQLASPIICVQMIDRCGKPFAHRNPGVVLLS